MSKILLKRKLTTGAPPLSNLSIGEPCLVIPDGALYWKKDALTLIGPIMVNLSDMTKSTYDTNNNGRVDTADNALQLGGKDASLYATNASVAEQVAALVGAAPEALNTFVELATKMQEDESGVAILTSLIGTKLDANSVIDGGEF